MPLREVLLKYWGYNSFRPLQEDIIQSVVDGKDTLALLPTGGGKSICYQVPGLYKPGLCLVVSPLIALMKDQVESLKSKGIKAVAIYSGMHREQIEIAINNCLFNEVKFLYLSPERLISDMMKENIQRLKINLIAVDEAHCISQWGYDFRPPYLRIAEIRQHHPQVPVLALTATATKEVVADIQEKLMFKKQNVIVKSFQRSNLSYIVFKEEDKLNRLMRIATRVKGTGIVYVRNRRKTKDISDFLNKNGIAADFYHAGLDIHMREKKQNEWMRGRMRMMVCTNAFGMGIDKPDVRFVVHMDLPDSIEAYFQEAGRAGRDEKKAYAVLLWEKADVISLYQSFEQTFPEPVLIKTVYNALGNFLKIPVGSGKEQSFDFDIQTFAANYSFQYLSVFSCLRILEREGLISLPDPEESFSRIHIKVTREDLYRYQVENAIHDNLIKVLLRMYGGLFGDFVRISEQDIAVKNNIKKDNIISMLNSLDKTGILTYIPAQTAPRVVFSTERLDIKNIAISHENYYALKARAESRLKAVIEYVNNSHKCRSVYLLNYFGEKNSLRCGTCDVCLERNKAGLNEVEFDEIIKFIKPFLKSSGKTMDEITEHVKTIQPEKIIRAVSWLVENEKIIYDTNNLTYHWK